MLIFPLFKTIGLFLMNISLILNISILIQFLGYVHLKIPRIYIFLISLQELLNIYIPLFIEYIHKQNYFLK